MTDFFEELLADAKAGKNELAKIRKNQEEEAKREQMRKLTNPFDTDTENNGSGDPYLVLSYSLVRLRSDLLSKYHETHKKPADFNEKSLESVREYYKNLRNVEIECRFGIVGKGVKPFDHRRYPHTPGNTAVTYDPVFSHGKTTAAKMKMQSGQSLGKFHVGVTSNTFEGIRQRMNELEDVEQEATDDIVYLYPENFRLAIPHDKVNLNRGRLEKKEKVFDRDICFPSSVYDLRISVSTEDLVEADAILEEENIEGRRNKKRVRYFTKKNKVDNDNMNEEVEELSRSKENKKEV